MQDGKRWITWRGRRILVNASGNILKNGFSLQKNKNKTKEYELDLENSWINYATQTEKKYFKKAIDYAIKNKMDAVKVNRIEFYFDFENNSVKIGTKNNLHTYKMRTK